jgi:O-antigen/teichoic acid export membrane protein
MNFISKFIYTLIGHRPNLVKIFNNIGWLFFEKLLRLGVGLFVWVWIARYLGAEQFGQLSFALSFVGLFGAFATLGIQGIVVRDIVRNPDCASETLGTAAILQLIGGMIAYLLILVAIAYVRPDDFITRTIVAILGSIILLKASEISIYWFESKVLSKYIVLTQSVVILFFSAVKVLLILKQASLMVFVWTMLVEAIVTAIILLCIMNILGPSLTKLHVSLKRAKSLLKDSWPVMVTVGFITVHLKISQIMLGQMLGDEAVGIYSVASRISESFYFIPMIISISVFPSLLEAKKSSEGEYYARLQKLYDLMVAISVGVVLLITLLSTPTINLLFDNDYPGADVILLIHSWTSIFVFLAVVSGNWFLTENLQKLMLVRGIFGCSLNIFLNFILIPLFSVSGAALATLLTHFFVDFLIDLASVKTRKIFLLKLRAFNIIGIYLRNFKT